MAPRLVSVAAVLAIATALPAADAQAGIRPFIWTWDTQTVPQGDVELEQWLWVRGKISPPQARPDLQITPAAYWIWWGPVLGLTERLEVAFPFQTVTDGPRFWLESFEVDARYRIFSRNDDGPLQPLLRAAFHQAINSPGLYSRLDVNAVLSYGALSELHATADLGARFFLPFLADSSTPAQVQLTYAAGVSHPLTDELTGALEVFGELDVANAPPDSDLPHHFAGGSLSYRKGRVWLTAGVLVGLTALSPTTPNFMPRLIWAVAL